MSLATGMNNSEIKYFLSKDLKCPKGSTTITEEKPLCMIFNVQKSELKLTADYRVMNRYGVEYV